jgi:phage terminase Nu1 subunit (DNA packaging protein)
MGEVITTKELSETLGVTQGRISQLKSQGRFDGCFQFIGKNKIGWDKDAAVAAYQQDAASTISTRINGSEQEIPSFNESRAKSEHFRAELARIDLELKEEKLCEVDKVQRQAFSMARSVRDALNSIPDRVANQFAAETDSVIIHKVLTDELRKALERLTDA